MIDLLSPVGDFDCLKAAVQNGANSVYFGSNIFSARAFASNFSLEQLEEAIKYAKLRGVKTNLTLNTLIKDNEFEEAFNLAKKAYEFGIDAIIVQDLGLGLTLIKAFPDLAIHASTQMSIHNLQGVLELQNLGFKRVVLSRELSISEIEYICQNSSIEIECFIHGALCISYSGQCLFSSMVGGRSGNRGQCAQPCRLPYNLFENNKKIDSGYLLSTRDLLGLEYIPNLINAGVHCLKIEGRMKNPEYVATVTRIYRKYIDLFYSDKNNFKIEETDKKALLQVFNRGQSSLGHLENSANKELIFKEKPNNMGLFLGKVEKYNKNKGLITVKLKEKIEISDTISLEKENGNYTISELMYKDKNIKETSIGQTVTIGRMKGNINLGDNIYKMTSKLQNSIAQNSIKLENRKIPLNCTITIKENLPISIDITSASNLEIYKNLKVHYEENIFPVKALNNPINKDRIMLQINKTSDYPYEFKNIEINLDENLFLPKLSSLNELRRQGLELIRKEALKNISRKSSYCFKKIQNKKTNNNIYEDKNISLLLNVLDLSFDYSLLSNDIKNIYIPLKYFINNKFKNILSLLNKKYNLYIYMPTIIKDNYRNLLSNNIKCLIEDYNIKGFILSNISNIPLINKIFDLDTLNKFDIVSNYTFNIFNKYSVLELNDLKIDRFTVSPELDNDSIFNICDSKILPAEVICYGKIPLMNMNYCLLGNSNKCYPDCYKKCQSTNKYYLEDRYKFTFDIIPDNIQTVTTIYNSRINSISHKNFNCQNVRIDILYEDIETINNIILKVKNDIIFEGKGYINNSFTK